MTAAAAAATTWATVRWVRVLDRMEHRRVDVGLRFWGPPLWLEITMTGPDSDRWPLTDGPDQEWNWQSSEACLEAMELAAAGAGDDRLLAVVSRYAVENLILNAVHEIGEWLRLDGSRPFPAHSSRAQSDDHLVNDDIDGNGSVHLDISFPPLPTSGGPVVRGPSKAQSGALDRVDSVVAASRFSYLPGTSISYGPAGPVVTGPDGPAAAWHAAWSSDVVEGTGAAVASDPVDHLVGAIAADVHRALVYYEADRVCRAFHVDGHRVWTVASDRRGRGGAGDPTDPQLRPLEIAISYAGQDPLGRPPSGHQSPTGAR